MDGVYRVRDGRLVAEPASYAVAGWDPRELLAYVRRIEAALDAGGAAFGAWDGERLAGLASVEPHAVGGDPAVLKLDLLYVSAPCRGTGIGRELVRRCAAWARARGARALYVSATPTRRTVDFYLRLGAALLATPDPALLALEPEDVHLLLPVDDR